MSAAPTAYAASARVTAGVLRRLTRLPAIRPRDRRRILAVVAELPLLPPGDQEEDGRGADS